MVEVFAGNGQSAAAGAHVPVAPAVRAFDAADQPVAGVQVRFEVTTGGGAVSGALKTTNAQGVATLESWTLGPSRHQYPERSVEGQTVSGEPLTFVATTDASSGYNIKIRYLGTPSSSQLLAFAQAEIRWESLVTGDLAGFPVQVAADDLLATDCRRSRKPSTICSSSPILQPIDGPGGHAGQAGPCAFGHARSPVVGVMFFDTDDLDLLEAEDLLDEVAIHEMGHVMGIGSLWGPQELLADAVATRRHRSAFHRRPGHRRV